MFTNVLNNFLNVRNKELDIDGNWVDQIRTDESLNVLTQNRVEMGPESEFTVIENWDTGIIIESLQYGTGVNVGPRLWTNEGAVESGSYAEELLHVPSPGGGRNMPIPARIRDDGHDYLEVKYSEEGNFTVGLKKPIYLPKGCRLDFATLPSLSTTSQLTFKLVYREIKKYNPLKKK
ncbi:MULTISPECIES: hypothetical protein [unclassified Oceanobacillus]|uniref:hypothetical protein n=1 Tax=unclassified Oceanobacillus TaxID=2630292 RepID=UPI001BE76446|nr:MULTISPECIES: hypothetical protein [unclassified Oceanobacillus]MBT2601431.1 hypothetical protein [Oceanobacillus sp. ISL-74]MBT2653292.1 hypothetical protein [Oceanobacillus sp. ISL-73]